MSEIVASGLHRGATNGSTVAVKLTHERSTSVYRCPFRLGGIPVGILAAHSSNAARAAPFTVLVSARTLTGCTI